MNSNNKKIIKQYVDRDTGEILDIHQGDKLQIVSKEQQNAIKKAIDTKEINEETKMWNDSLGGFIFVLFKYCDSIMNQYPEIITEDITKLFYLATYVNYEGYLMYKNKHMSRKIMQNLLNMSRERFGLFYNKMKKLNIFTVDKDKKIKINPNYFIKGDLPSDIKVNYNYTRMYINTIRYLFENVSIRKHKQLGMYFKLIPFIHRQQNILCKNPESLPKDIVPMNVKELKDILGYHRNSVRNFLKELFSTKLNNGESILGTFRTDYDEGKSFIIINPRVFYGGNFDIDGKQYGILKWFKTNLLEEGKRTM